jgi:hypothetical protein
MRRMKRTALILVLVLAGTFFAWAQWSDYRANRDWKTVEKLIGFPGEARADGFKVTVPRSDLNVLVHGTLVDPQAGLASWFALKPLRKGSFLSGELTVTDAEVPLVEARLASGDLTLTSIYRPFNGETPGIERIRLRGQGSRVQLAEEARDLLAATTMPLTPAPAALSAPLTAMSALLEKNLGMGQWTGTAYTLTYAPAQPVTEENIEVPSYIGLETVFHFQGEGQQAKAYGQWVLKPLEARAVIQSLMKNHIVVTETHSELIEPMSGLVQVDFWAEGEPEKIAKSLKQALAKTQLVLAAPDAHAENQKTQTH